MGQALTAKLRVAAEAGPAVVHIDLVGLLETFGCGDFVRLRVELAALGVATDVERKDHLGGELAGLLQHRVDGLGVDVGVRRHLLEVLGDLEHLMHHELHVAQGRVVNGHGKSPVRV
jgi:hypothetical protein